MASSLLLNPAFGRATPFQPAARSPHHHGLRPAWELDTVGLACADISCRAPSRAVVHELVKLGYSRLWQELHNVAAALRSADVLTPESEQQLQEAMAETHEVAHAAERELARTALLQGAEQNGALLLQGQRWLHQLQDLMVALQRDVLEGRQALEAGLPRAEQDWQLLLHMAHTKLEPSICAVVSNTTTTTTSSTTTTTTTTTSSGVSMSLSQQHQRLTEGAIKRDPFTAHQQHQHQHQQHQALDSHDSSCSSSVCGSASCTTTSSVGGTITTTTSAAACSSHGSSTSTHASAGAAAAAGGQHHRVVASRSRLSYGHWRGKATL